MSECVDDQNRWQTLLKSFKRCEARHKGLSRLRSVSLGLLILSVAMLLFLLDTASGSRAFLFLLATLGIAISLPMSVVVRTQRKRVHTRKNELARRIFDAGLRVEDEYLVTNVAHSQVVATLNDERE